ncbi:hypothetical protein BT67DRAFT_148318 [Trichocladium antarcticum]|uniref:Uncharacterized protein n=1 Tax=Trichocladium antarcticum TaxID=1450529 RepID=A0AAN6UFE3_9PEZI|nr:hypothetical protein BT67DRAFT_148318 [Trichocladium antarcticum]
MAALRTCQDRPRARTDAGVRGLSRSRQECLSHYLLIDLGLQHAVSALGLTMRPHQKASRDHVTKLWGGVSGALLLALGSGRFLSMPVAPERAANPGAPCSHTSQRFRGGTIPGLPWWGGITRIAQLSCWLQNDDWFPSAKHQPLPFRLLRYECRYSAMHSMIETQRRGGNRTPPFLAAILVSGCGTSPT